MPSPYQSRVVLSQARRDALAARLQARREARGLTRETLATRAQVTVEQVQRLERGAANPTLATLYALADALDDPLSALFD